MIYLCLNGSIVNAFASNQARLLGKYSITITNRQLVSPNVCQNSYYQSLQFDEWSRQLLFFHRLFCKVVYRWVVLSLRSNL